MFKFAIQYSLIAFLLLTTACQEQENTIPVSLEQAAAIILDVHSAENAALTAYGARKDSIINVYYQQICAIHQIDSTTLRAIIQEARSNPEFSRDVYNEAERQLDQRSPEN